MLRPLLRLTLGELDDWMQRHWCFLHPPRYRELLDFSLMTKALLQPPRGVGPSGVVVVESELEEGRDAEPAFSDAAWAAFDRVYTGLPQQFRLSECLDRLQSGERSARHLAILRIGQWFEGRADDPGAEDVGEDFSRDGFYGTTSWSQNADDQNS